jgi:3-oxoacyl-[acyl-carrier-protein] synthase-1
MESIAFSRAGLSAVPMHGLKGYFGHTLGAAGIIESAICMQSMRNGVRIASLGFETPGTSEPLNVQRKSEKGKLNLLLKTASGFGGCNASAIFRKV